MVITVAHMLMAEGREEGCRLKKIWCLLSEGGGNAEGNAEGRAARPALRVRRNTNLCTLFFFLNFKFHSSSENS